MKTRVLFFILLASSIIQSAFACDPGYYLNVDNECVVCTSGYYCVGDGTKTKCPETNLTVNQLAELCGLASVASFAVGSKEQTNKPNSINFCSLHLNSAYDDMSMVYAFITYDEVTKEYTNCHKLKLFIQPQNGYYLGDITASGWSHSRYACTNTHPSNSHYSGAGTPNGNDCPWECDSGYGQTDGGQCLQLCSAGVTEFHTGDLMFNIYATKQTTPSINIKYNDTVCYVSLAMGSTTNALHVKYENTTYHTIN